VIQLNLSEFAAVPTSDFMATLTHKHLDFLCISFLGEVVAMHVTPETTFLKRLTTRERILFLFFFSFHDLLHWSACVLILESPVKVNPTVSLIYSYRYSRGCYFQKVQPESVPKPWLYLTMHTTSKRNSRNTVSSI